ncbi:MAG: hypothetical protein AABY27_00065 [Pseudomonadota bacterium]
MLNKLFCTLIFLVFSSISFAEEVYIVKSIKISAINKNANIARNAAIEEGQIKAFTILVKKHFPSASMGTISDDKILNTVSGFELSDEKRSATNYFAKINVKFNKKQIDDIMNSIGADFKEKEQITEIAENHQSFKTPAEPTTTLLIPIYKSQGKTAWLDDDNSWLQFWNNIISSDDFKAHYVLPLGDLEDIAIINQNIFNRDIVDLSSLYERYNVNNIALIKLEVLESSPTNHFALQASFINKNSFIWQKHNFSDLEGADLNQLFKNSAKEVKNFDFASIYNKKLHPDFTITDPFNIEAEVVVKDYSDWLEIEKAILSSKYISNFLLKKISFEKYLISFTYHVSFSDLQTIFKNHNFDLQDLTNNKFTITKNLNKDEQYASF